MTTQAPPEPLLPRGARVELGHRLRKVYVGWVLAALVLTFLRFAQLIPREFDYAHASAVGDYTTAARTFVNNGLAALRGVPMGNNGPLGVDPPVYTHWPPLYQLLLAGWFRVFGVSEATAHVLMLGIWIVSAIALGAALRMCLSFHGACAAMLAWIALPVTVRFAHTPMLPHLSMMFLFLATVGYLKKRTGWGLVAVALSVLSSWEGALLGAGLAAVALHSQDRAERRRAFLFLGVGIATAIGVVGWYVTAYPHQLADLWGVLQVRMRLVDSYTADPLNMRTEVPISTAGIILLQALRTWNMIGSMGLFAIALLGIEAFRSRGRAWNPAFTTTAAAWAGVWIIWYTVLSHHPAHHDFQAMIIAPLAALAVGRLVERGLDAQEKSRGGDQERVIAWAIIVPAILLYPAVMGAYRPSPPEPEDRAMATFGQEIHRNTPEGSVVIIPEWHGVIVYYSGRRMVWAINSPERLKNVLTALPDRFPQHPRVFFAASRLTSLDPAMEALLPPLEPLGEVRIAEITPSSGQDSFAGAASARPQILR